MVARLTALLLPAPSFLNVREFSCYQVSCDAERRDTGTRLSDQTGDPEYASLTQLAESYLLEPKPAWAEPYDGLVGSNIKISTGEFADDTVSWSGGADSFYEYLLKMYVYDKEEFGFYGERYDGEKFLICDSPR